MVVYFTELIIFNLITTESKYVLRFMLKSKKKKKKKTNDGFSKIDYFGIVVVILAILVCMFYLMF
jgi:hypothetical protein